MPDKSTDPISDSLRAAFNQAVAVFRNWDYGLQPNPISYEGWPYSISEICERAMVFPDPVPGYIYNEVAKLAEELQAGRERVWYPYQRPKDHSYASVAECLQRLYAARKAYYEARAAELRSRGS
jgi:hypothetical protein